jgi:hypothetical protein
MSLQTYATIVLAVLSAAAPGCATRAMRGQAAALADAGDRLENEAAAFAAARTAVVQLRQRGLVQRRQEVAEQGQYNARTVAQWKVAGSEDRARRLALFDAIVGASEAMYEVRDQGLLWEESVLYSESALAIDRAALHRFVRQLVALSRPIRFIEGVKFYASYGAQVAAQVDAGFADVKAGIAAAQAAASERPDAGPDGPEGPAGPRWARAGPDGPKGPDPPAERTRRAEPRSQSRRRRGDQGPLVRR